MTEVKTEFYYIAPAMENAGEFFKYWMITDPNLFAAILPMQMGISGYLAESPEYGTDTDESELY
jgi:hypothetical protein